MTIWLQNLVDDYYRWLREKTEIVQADGGWTVISTPFLGAFNDAIEIYARQTGGKIILSDDGETLHNLELQGSGVTRSKKRREHMDRILRNYGVLLRGDELQAEADEKDFPQKKHSLLAAIAEVNDMFVLARPSVEKFFKEDVEEFLIARELIYTPQFICRGTTKIEFVFDFLIAGRRQEIVIKAFNSLNRLNVAGFLFSWQDIREVRQKVSRKEVTALAVINDEEKDVREEFPSAIKSKGADSIPWTERLRDEHLNKLVAL